MSEIFAEKLRFGPYSVGIGTDSISGVQRLTIQILTNPIISMLTGGAVNENAANGTVVATFGITPDSPDFILDDSGASGALAITTGGILTKVGTLDFATHPIEHIVVRDVSTGTVAGFDITVNDVAGYPVLPGAPIAPLVAAGVF
jgi:hypothetical protein